VPRSPVSSRPSSHQSSRSASRCNHGVFSSAIKRPLRLLKTAPSSCTQRPAEVGRLPRPARRQRARHGPRFRAAAGAAAGADPAHVPAGRARGHAPHQRPRPAALGPRLPRVPALLAAHLRAVHRRRLTPRHRRRLLGRQGLCPAGPREHLCPPGLCLACCARASICVSPYVIVLVCLCARACVLCVARVCACVLCLCVLLCGCVSAARR
jgi:hypothetical protein